VIPRRVRLHNFLSYRDCTVDFSGLHLAVLAGKNGDGKSALLDAMTWAVWGKARGSVEDDRIRMGDAGDMFVEFEFEARGDRFQVIRKRTRGKTGDLHFFQVGPEGFKTAMTGGTMRETQAAIDARIRLQYDTFASSAFVAQGRANEFTTKEPSKRKEVFRQILGLQLYEELAGKATDRKKEAVAELRALARGLEEDEREVALLPGVEADLVKAAAGLAEAEPAVRAVEREVSELRDLATGFERLKGDLLRARDRLERVEKAAAQDAGQLCRVEKGIAEAAALLENAPAVRERYEALLALRGRERALAGLQQEARDIEGDLHRAAAEIAREETRLRTEAEGLDAELAKNRKAVECLPALQAESQALDREKAEVELLRAGIDEALAKLAEVARRTERVNAQSDGFKAEGNALLARRKQLAEAEDAAACPVCLQPMSGAEIEHVLAGYSEQIAALRKQVADCKAEMEELVASASKLETEVTAGRERLRRQETALQAKQQEHHARVRQAEAASAAIPGLEAQVAERLSVIERGVFAEEARAARCAARERLAALGYDADEHRRVRDEIDGLEPLEAEQRAIEAAEQRQEGLDTQRDQLTTALAERELERCAARQEASEAEGRLALAEDIGPQLAAKEEEQTRLRGLQMDLVREQARLESERRRLQGVAAKIEGAREDAAAHREAEQTYTDLARGFGRDGVQAMLIEQALPQLERVANGMLDRMTGGRIGLALLTQKVSEKGAVRETLDIRISDELGTRDYEMYSGGEAFRVDFALRIALARLLADRAGTDLPTLIIDEGFGSQDAEGIDRLVEAIQAVKDDFELILVVTHVEELRERFERRIEVTKDPVRGSYARVV
jgi:DNA repair protein SbcC/Rad50